MKRKIKIGFGERIFDVVNVLITSSLTLIILIPLLSILFASLSDPVEVMRHQGLFLFPKGINFGAYIAVSKNPSIISGYLNTIFIVVVGTSINIVLTLIGAYVLSRKNTLLVRPITLMIVFTMYFQGGTIPFYLVVRNVGLDNSIWALIFPVAISTFNLIIMRTAMVGVPESLPESAMIDGAGHVRILFQIMMPLVQATVAVLLLYYAVAHWNAWFNAMIFLRNRRLYPLQLILREIIIHNNAQMMMGNVTVDEQGFIGETIRYATIVVATIPILCIYPFLQRYFVKGVMIGALKG